MGADRRRQEAASQWSWPEVFRSSAATLVWHGGLCYAHYWEHVLTRLAHKVRLMPAKDVKAYVKRKKIDAAGGAAPV